jgi:hypothetical protein
MSLINAAFGRTLDGLLLPFAQLPAAIGVVWMALVTAAGVLLVVRRVSDQDAITRVKRRLQASLFEIRLFNDDPRAIVRAQLDILRNNVTYLRLSVVPMLWVIPILVPLMVHLDARYGRRSVAAGDVALVGVTLAERADDRASERPSIDLELPGGIGPSPPSVWIPGQRRMVWRLDVRAAGVLDLGFLIDGRRYSKRLRVDTGVAALAPVRVRAGLWRQLLDPAETPLPADGAVETISVDYPARGIGVTGWSTNWIVVYLIATLIWVLVLRGRFGVTL